MTMNKHRVAAISKEFEPVKAYAEQRTAQEGERAVVLEIPVTHLARGRYGYRYTTCLEREVDDYKARTQGVEVVA